MGIHLPNPRVLFYITLHPTLGLFWQSPDLLFLFVGAPFMFADRRYREEAVLAMGVIVSYLVIMSGYYMWWGGWALSCRHIIPILPFFSVFLIFVPKRFTWLLVILTLVSIGQMVIGAASTVHVPDTMVLKIDTLRFFEYSQIYSYCLESLRDGHYAWNRGHALLGLKSWRGIIPLLAVISGGFIYFRQKRSSVGDPHEKEIGLVEYT